MQQESKDQPDLNVPDTAFTRRLGRMLGGAALLGASGTALAQSITYQPLATAIPSLSGVGLVLLATLMAGAVWHFNRNGKGMPGGRFMGLALVVGAVASGASGVKLMGDAWATSLPIVQLDAPAGGTKPLQPGLNCVVNITSVTQQVVDIDTNIQSGNGGTTSIQAGDRVVGVANGGQVSCPDNVEVLNPGVAPVCSEAPNGTILQRNDVCSVQVGASG